MARSCGIGWVVSRVVLAFASCGPSGIDICRMESVAGKVFVAQVLLHIAVVGNWSIYMDPNS